MKSVVTRTPAQAGEQAAKQAAAILNDAIKKKGKARLLLSAEKNLTLFFREFVKQKVAWERVEMFHTFEYVSICPDHPASCNRYIRREFLEVVFPGMEHLIMGCLPPEKIVEDLTRELREEPIDVAIIAVEENGTVGFNEAPIDVLEKELYRVVTLSPEMIEKQKKDDGFEGEIYPQAITITPNVLMECKQMICISFLEAKEKTACENILQKHKNCTVYCNKA